MANGMPAARVGDPIGHSCALPGALAGLAVGALIGVAIVATGGLGVVAIGAALAVTGGAGLAGEYIGASIPGPPTGVIVSGSSNVLINGRPASAVTIGVAPCAREHGMPQREATGAASVFINGLPAGRVGESFTCSARILSGSSDVIIGGPSAQALAIASEVPAWLNTAMQVMAIGGTVLATAGIWATLGAGVALGGLGAGLVGGLLAGVAGRSAAEALGFGETGQRVAEVVGGFLGSAVAGGLGTRMGRKFTAGQSTATPEMIAESKAAYQRALDSKAALPENQQYHAKTTASDGKSTISGWKQTELPDIENVSVEKVSELSKKIGHDLDEHPYDAAFEGQYYASHAEKKLSIISPNEPAGVSKPMCTDCKRYYSKLAQYRGVDQVVTDRKGTWIFKADGTIVSPEGITE